MIVKFNNSLTQAAYEALLTKDGGTLYFTTDTKRVYKGSTLYSDDVVVLTTLPSTGVANKLYITNDGTNVQSYIWDGSAFKALSSTPVGQVLTGVSFNETTQVLTFTYSDATTTTVDLALESVVQGVSYNSTTKVLTFTLVSGLTTTVTLTDLIDAYTGSTTDNATVTVGSSGIISCTVKISAVAGNQLTSSSAGLYVAATDISGKIDKVGAATVGHVAVFASGGGVSDSGKAIVTSIGSSGSDANIPTEKAVSDALTWG